jgi:hypothetical protein
MPPGEGLLQPLHNNRKLHSVFRLDVERQPVRVKMDAPERLGVPLIILKGENSVADISVKHCCLRQPFSRATPDQ